MTTATTTPLSYAAHIAFFMLFSALHTITRVSLLTASKALSLHVPPKLPLLTFRMMGGVGGRMEARIITYNT